MSVPSCTTDMSSERMMRHHAVGDAGRVDVGTDGAGDLLAAQALGARLAQLGQGGDLEHPGGDLGLEAGEQPPGQRVAVERADEREDQV